MSADVASAGVGMHWPWLRGYRRPREGRVADDDNPTACMIGIDDGSRIEPRFGHGIVRAHDPQHTAVTVSYSRARTVSG